jgi:hypothetical protein
MHEKMSVVTDDVAEFVGPVKLESVPGAGRGMIAVEDIGKGQTVMCSRALALFVEERTDEIERNMYVSMNFGTNSANIKPGHDYVVGEIANKIACDPQLGKSINQLWAGREMKCLEQTDPAADKVDMKRIERIVTLNSFGTNDSMNIGDRSGMSWSGLWLIPSYINHSCSEANCQWIRYGDMMQIVASRPIKAGEQLLIMYIGRNERYELRKKSCECHGKIRSSGF